MKKSNISSQKKAGKRLKKNSLDQGGEILDVRQDTICIPKEYNFNFPIDILLLILCGISTNQNRIFTNSNKGKVLTPRFNSSIRNILEWNGDMFITGIRTFLMIHLEKVQEVQRIVHFLTKYLKMPDNFICNN